MYTLRKIITDGVESNTALGSCYNVIKAESSRKEFEKTFKMIFNDVEVYFTEKDITGNLEYDNKNFWLDAELAYSKGFRRIYANTNLYDINDIKEAIPVQGFGEVYAFVTSEGGKDIYPLFKNQRNYIMTENGKTFSNLSFRN